MARNKYPEQTRTKIVDTAFKLFGEKGYESVVMQDIMDASSLSRGAIYHHFKNKNEIMQAVLDKLQQDDSAFFSQMMTKKLSAQERIAQLVDYIVTSKSRAEMAKMMWSNKNHIVLYSNVTNTLHYAAPQVAAIIRQGIEAGDFKIDYPDETAEILMLLLNIWLDPTLGAGVSSQKVKRRFNFFQILLRDMNLPLFSESALDKLQHYYLGFVKED